MIQAMLLVAVLLAPTGQQIFRRPLYPVAGETFRYYILNGQVFTESSNSRSWVQNGQIFSETL